MLLPHSRLDRRWTLPLLGAPFALMLLIAAAGGPDCLRYLDWARAVRGADILQLGDGTLSPLGLPLSQWSHGPGLFYALPRMLPWPYALVPAELLGPLDDFRLVGWLASLALWFALFRSMRQLLGGAVSGSLLLCAIAFGGTHLGFYSLQHASESLSLGCLALLAYWLIVPRSWRALDVLFVATLCALLIVIRTHLGFYILPALGWMIYRLRSQSGSWKQRLTYTALIALPLSSALVQIAWVNRWMTGSILRSPYAFGDANFSSLDLARPELLAVLVHPWHGLLVYHPLYGVGFALLLWRTFRTESPAQRRLFGSIALALMAHLYLQASWYCWWMGVGTFGMRGMAASGVLLLPVIAHVMARRIERGKSNALLLTLLLGCCGWSFLLMIQGMTNFMTYGELVGAQVRTLLRPDVLAPLALFGLLALTLTRGRHDTGRRSLAAAAIFLVCWTAYYLCGLVIDLETALLRALPFRLGLGGLIGVLAALTLGRGKPQAPPIYRPALLLPAAVVTLVIVTNLLFARLAFQTEQHILNSEGPPPSLAAQAVDLDEVEESYFEYLRVPGFHQKKTALARFLEQNDRISGERR